MRFMLPPIICALPGFLQRCAILSSRPNHGSAQQFGNPLNGLAHLLTVSWLLELVGHGGCRYKPESVEPVGQTTQCARSCDLSRNLQSNLI